VTRYFAAFRHGHAGKQRRIGAAWHERIFACGVRRSRVAARAQQRHRHLAHQFLGDAPHEQPSKSASPVRTDHQHIGLRLLDGLRDLVGCMKGISYTQLAQYIVLI
jgi:hypothetical protein